MAALTGTRQVKRLQIGDRVLMTVSFTIANADAADEWIAKADLGLSWIDAVVGAIAVGTAKIDSLPAIVENAQGTGVTAGTNPGDLGVEGTAGAYQITVIGKPK